MKFTAANASEELFRPPFRIPGGKVARDRDRVRVRRSGSRRNRREHDCRDLPPVQQAAKQEQTRLTSAWLAKEIDRLRANVAQPEAKVEQYRAKTNLFIGNNNTTLSNQQLGDFNTQLAAARAQKADAESKAKVIRDALKSGARIEFSEITNSELMRRLTEQRVTLTAQLAEQSSTLLDQHPRIKELRAQIADLERQMRSEADRLARSVENDAKLASGKVEELSAALDHLKRQAGSTNEQDVQLRALERDAK
ncbi:MAG: hypothetical protein ABWZ64_09730 [Xanthobacteraceae bacterium]